MAKRRETSPEPAPETRKQTRLRARSRRKNQRILLGAGVALGLALLVLLVGAVDQLLIRPASPVATVNGQEMSTREFRKRYQLERTNLQNQLLTYQQFQSQFGSSANQLFASQIAQLQTTLDSPFALGLQVMDQMIEEQVLAGKAAELGVSVSSDEVEEALREEIASGEGAVTVPQATSTAEAAAVATVTAASFTPTPSPTIDASMVVTATATPSPTPEPVPTRPILADTAYQEGLTRLEENLQQIAGMNLEDYRQVVRARLLWNKLEEEIGGAEISPTETQLHARHILLTERDPVPTPAESPTPVAEGEPTPTPTPQPRDDAATLALAQELRQRLLAGEEFETLAATYSDDPGSASQGGDLGWFSRGRMVPEFEEAAFSLAVGEISQPIKTDFGYHLIEVLERDENRPKDEGLLRQERTQSFQSWVESQVAAANVTRTDDLISKLPTTR